MADATRAWAALRSCCATSALAAVKESVDALRDRIRESGTDGVRRRVVVELKDELREMTGVSSHRTALMRSGSAEFTERVREGTVSAADNTDSLSREEVREVAAEWVPSSPSLMGRKGGEDGKDLEMT
jgi:hypothetical protein